MKTIENTHEPINVFPFQDVIICDFDGTITQSDVTDKIVQEFGASNWQDIGEKYVRGEISHEQMNTDFVKSLHASPAQLIRFVEQNVSIREDFFEFLTFCKKRSILPIIASGGWDFYIKIILSEVNLHFIRSLGDLTAISDDAVPVICNNLSFDERTNSWNVNFMFANGSQKCTPDKRMLVDYLRTRGVKNITVIGDGSTDHDMARGADEVFSCNGLAQYCEEQGISHNSFSSFRDIITVIAEMRDRTIKVLSLPSYHPYNKRFNNGREINFANPNCDFFTEKLKHSSERMDAEFPSDTYDIVHIHFEYYLISPDALADILEYFKKRQKPIVWTCHDRRGLLEDAVGDEYENLLFNAANAITTLTDGCANYLKAKFGTSVDIEVIKHGYIAHPAIVESEEVNIKKDRNLFTLHIGDFRKSKEYIRSILDFLECPGLKNARLQIIFRPINIYPDDDEIRSQLKVFYEIIRNPRIETICMPDIPDIVLTRAFLASHAVILPYKWGTHSGQVELAKDCGCHVIATNVGFYKEQWDDVHLWETVGKRPDEKKRTYQASLAEIYGLESLRPAGRERQGEFNDIVRKHVLIYKQLIDARGR